MKSAIKIVDSAVGYDWAADKYDDKEKYLNSFEQGKLLPLLGDLQNKKILEIGAGTGRFTVQLVRSGAEVLATDISAAMLAVLQRKLKNKVTVQVVDAESLPFTEATFDMVIATFLIVHLKDPRRFFDEAYRVLKPRGQLVITNINQKEPPEIKTAKGAIKITSYYHRPEKIREILEDLAFGIKHQVFVAEKDVWINQLLVAEK